MNVIVLDFETRSEADLGKIGSWVYSKHPTTTVLCMAYKINDEETKVIDFRKGFEIPKDLLNILEGEFVIEAFNASFEFAIWSHILSDRHNWPVVSFSRYTCVQARAARFALPRSLEEVAEVLELGVEKDSEGRRIMLQLCKPKKPSKKDPSIWYDDDERFQKLLKYCIKDVDVTYAIRKRLLRMTKQKNYFIKKSGVKLCDEKKVFVLNNVINRLGVQCDTELAEKSLKLIEVHEQLLLEDLVKITKGRLTSANQNKEMLALFHEAKIHIPNFTKETVELWLDRTEGIYRRILEIRQQLGKASVKKISAMLRRTYEGRIRDLLLYYGASRTGRFAGQGIQVQNFPAPKLEKEEIEEAINMIKGNSSYPEFSERFPNVLDVVSSCLRGMLVPKDGALFLDSDFSAIEARVLFWLAGEKEGLRAYHEGADIYKEMASTIYDRKIVKKGAERDLGKRAILGGGYGMGHKKFQATCEQYNQKVTEELAKKAISTYREKYVTVPKLWKNVERASIESILHPGRHIKCGKVTMYSFDNYLYIILPSGRALAYNSPRLRPKWGNQLELTYMHPKNGQWVETKTWGGKLVENITQAVARDLMTEAMLRIQDADYPVVFTVHDQVISEVMKDKVNLEEFNKLMEILPEWAEGCPITAETKITRRFEK